MQYQSNITLVVISSSTACQLEGWRFCWWSCMLPLAGVGRGWVGGWLAPGSIDRGVKDNMGRHVRNTSPNSALLLLLGEIRRPLVRQHTITCSNINNNLSSCSPRLHFRLFIWLNCSPRTKDDNRGELNLFNFASNWLCVFKSCSWCVK